MSLPISIASRTPSSPWRHRLRRQSGECLLVSLAWAPLRRLTGVDGCRRPGCRANATTSPSAPRRKRHASAPKTILCALPAGMAVLMQLPEQRQRQQRRWIPCPPCSLLTSILWRCAGSARVASAYRARSCDAVHASQMQPAISPADVTATVAKADEDSAMLSSVEAKWREAKRQMLEEFTVSGKIRVTAVRAPRHLCTVRLSVRPDMCTLRQNLIGNGTADSGARRRVSVPAVARAVLHG